MVDRLMSSYGASERHARRVLCVTRGTYRYRSCLDPRYLVYRLCKEEGLMLKRMKPAGKRKAARLREEKVKPTAPNGTWSMDFVADQLQDGGRFRSLTIVDVYTREAVAIEVGQSPEGRRCSAHPEQAEARAGHP
jgi:putative transposase